MIGVLGFFFGKNYLKKYTYTKERADLNAYLGIEDEHSYPVIYRGEKSDLEAREFDGEIYIPFETALNMFNDRFYVGGGAGLMLGALGQPVYTVQGFADAMAYWFPRKSTLTTGVRVGYIKNFSGGDLFHADVTVGWSWGLPSGHGLSANIGLSGSRGMSIIAIDLISLSLSLAPVLSVAYEF